MSGAAETSSVERPTSNFERLKEEKAELIAKLESIDTQLCEREPLMNPARFEPRPPQFPGDPGLCIDMTGQPEKCEECGAPYYRRGAYLFCEKNKDEHWRFIDCSEEAQEAALRRWTRGAEAPPTLQEASG